MQIPVSRRLSHLLTCSLICLSFIQFLRKEYKFPGDHIPGVPPVPIPNTAVKPRVADGSRTLGPARVGRCQVYGPDVAKAASGPFCFLALTSFAPIFHAFRRRSSPALALRQRRVTGDDDREHRLVGTTQRRRSPRHRRLLAAAMARGDRGKYD